MKKLAIFDFDGVLVDSFDAWYKINTHAFKKALGKNFTKRQYRNCYIAELNKGFKKISGSKINYQKLKFFKDTHKEDFFLKYYSRIKLFPFIKNLISRLKQLNVKLVIVTSSTNPLGVRKLLKKFRIDKNFVVTASSEGESKISHLKKILRRFNFKPSNAYFISDTYNDIKWGKEVGLKNIAVLWGFHNRKTLARAKPDFMVKNYKEILKIIENSL